MKIITDGIVNINNIQTMCLVFFPGSKFSESDNDENTLYVKTYSEEGKIYCDVKLEAEGKVASHTEVCEESKNTAKDYKTVVGRAVFNVCKELTGYEPPWGMLTGVRPVKLAADYMRLGNNQNETSKFFTEFYNLNPKKARLVTRVGAKEIKLLKDLPSNNCALYISIPFCPSRCAYCSFVSYFTPRLVSLIPDYVDQLCKDIKTIVSHIKKTGLVITDIYVGGGTPTILSEALITKLMNCISNNIDISSLNEFTFEGGRPDTITKEKLDLLASFGVNRISINPQTLNNSVLEEIGRKHSDSDFYNAYELARNNGKFRINTDIIAGLPGESFASFSRTVDGILALEPENITVHTFCVKKSADFLKADTELYSRSGGATGKSIEYAQMKLQRSGYSPYYLYRQKNTVGNLENTGYTKEGFECMYNIYMMQEVRNVFACGAGAITRLVSANGKKLKRYAMPKYPYEYLMKDVHDAKIEEELNLISKFEAEEKLFESTE